MQDESSPTNPVDLNAELASITALEAIKASPQVAARFANELLRQPGMRGIVYRARPKGTYYNLQRALELKVILDKYLEDGKPIWLYVRNFKRANLNTLYARINQSFLYLCEDEIVLKEYGTKYRELRFRTKICREEVGTSNEAVVIQGTKDIGAEVEPLVIGEALVKVSSEDWQTKMDLYLADPLKTEPLILKGLSLTTEQVSSVEDSLNQLEGILASITSDKIKIVKYSAEKEA